jgi:predicted transcriptional regulator
VAGSRSRSSGELEALVMRALWNTDAAMNARAIQATFEDPTPALTTLLTVLSRLEEKGLVEREAPSPRKVRFRAAVSSGEAHARQMIASLDDAPDRSGALLAFADTLSAEDVDLIMSALPARGRRKDRGS